MIAGPGAGLALSWAVGAAGGAGGVVGGAVARRRSAWPRAQLIKASSSSARGGTPLLQGQLLELLAGAAELQGQSSAEVGVLRQPRLLEQPPLDGSWRGQVRTA